MWLLVLKSSDQAVVEFQYVFKVKEISKETDESFKSTGFNKGLWYKCVLDCNKTFSLVVKMLSIRLRLDHARWRGLKAIVNISFLIIKLDDMICIDQSESFVFPRRPNDVYLRKKTLYIYNQNSNCFIDAHCGSTDLYELLLLLIDPAVFHVVSWQIWHIWGMFAAI